MAFTGKLFGMGTNMDVIGGTFGSTATAFGNNMWIIIALIVNFAIMAFGVADGIEKANKFYDAAAFRNDDWTGYLHRNQPGAVNGYKYIFTVNPEGLRM